MFLTLGCKASPAWCSNQKTRYNHPVLFHWRDSVEECGWKLKQHWVNATCLRKVYSRPGDRLVLEQRRRRLTGIEPAMGCNAGPALNRNLAGRPTSSVRARTLYEVHRRQVLNECWSSPAMVVEGIHVQDIFELVSLRLSLIIFWTFRILALRKTNTPKMHRYPCIVWDLSFVSYIHGLDILHCFWDM